MCLVGIGTYIMPFYSTLSGKDGSDHTNSRAALIIMLCITASQQHEHELLYVYRHTDRGMNEFIYVYLLAETWTR